MAEFRESPEPELDTTRILALKKEFLTKSSQLSELPIFLRSALGKSAKDGCRNDAGTSPYNSVGPKTPKGAARRTDTCQTCGLMLEPRNSTFLLRKKSKKLRGEKKKV